MQPGKLGEIGIALVFEVVDQTSLGGIKSKYGHLFDEAVGGEAVVFDGGVALRRRHLFHQSQLGFRRKRAEVRLREPVHCLAPILLGFRSIFGRGVDDKIEVLGDTGFTGARRFVGGNQYFGEGFERGELSGREEFGLVIRLRRPHPVGEEFGSSRRGQRAAGQRHQIAPGHLAVL